VALTLLGEEPIVHVVEVSLDDSSMGLIAVEELVETLVITREGE